jgi:hypothetical protein
VLAPAGQEVLPGGLEDGVAGGALSHPAEELLELGEVAVLARVAQPLGLGALNRTGEQLPHVEQPLEHEASLVGTEIHLQRGSHDPRTESLT